MYLCTVMFATGLVSAVHRKISIYKYACLRLFALNNWVWQKAFLEVEWLRETSLTATLRWCLSCQRWAFRKQKSHLFSSVSHHRWLSTHKGSLVNIFEWNKASILGMMWWPYRMQTAEKSRWEGTWVAILIHSIHKTVFNSHWLFPWTHNVFPCF